MPNNELFVNPEEIRICANRLRLYAEEMKNTLDGFRMKIKSTAPFYESKSATEMRNKFTALEPELEKFTAYIKKVSAYLDQNVADPSDTIEQINSQNIAKIRKPM